jgi:cyclase
MIQTYGKRILVETEYDGANVSCIRTQNGLVLVDSPFLPGDAREWAGRIREKTGREVAYQINTDHHFDHVMGNEFLTDNIICHTTAVRGIKYIRNKQALKDIIRPTHPEISGSLEAEIDALRIPLPLIAFDSRLILDMGDATFHLEYVGGHSPATILIHLPEEKAVFTGDNVEGQFPYFGQGRFYQWKEILHKILAMDVDLVVPGHGPVGGKEMVQTYIDFFEKLEEEVSGYHSKGMSVDEMAKQSGLIGFFPREDPAEALLKEPWLREQYKFAAKQVLENG